MSGGNRDGRQRGTARIDNLTVQGARGTDLGGCCRGARRQTQEKKDTGPDETTADNRVQHLR
jgi:hypothetical protein